MTIMRIRKGDQVWKIWPVLYPLPPVSRKPGAVSPGFLQMCLGFQKVKKTTRQTRETKEERMAGSSGPKFDDIT